MAELRFDGRTAIVTGGGRGLGRAYALLLASRGANIIVNDVGGSMRGDGVDAGPAEEVVQEIKAAGGKAAACAASVATPKGGNEIIKAAMDNFGSADIVIHSAGNVRRGALKEFTQDDFDAVLDVHLKGAYHVVRAAFPHMVKAKYGRIVLTSSIGGLYGNANVVNYSTAKAGMIGLSNVAALEGAADGIKSNLIIPAAVTRMSEGIDTSQFPPMDPSLVAPAVAWLCHESCSVSGEMLISAAGRIARAYVVETQGVFQPSWTIEQVGEQMDAIRNADDPLVFPPVPSGFMDHLGYSFQMARKG